MTNKYRLTKVHLYQRNVEYVLNEDGTELVPELNDTTEELDPQYVIYEYVDGEWEEYDSTRDEEVALEEYKELIKGEQ